MTNKEKIEYLKRYSVCYKEIERLYEEKERLTSIRDKITQTLSDMPKGSNGDKSNVADSIIELDYQIEYEVAKWIRTGDRIKNIMESVQDDNLKLLLRYRYINNMKFEEIAVKMGYCWKQIHRLHNNALNAIEIN
jgi:hypothetical protein